MKTVLRRSLTTLVCMGALIAGTQSWANDAKDLSNSKSNAVTTAKKAQEPCSKPCKMNKDNKVQQEPIAKFLIIYHNRSYGILNRF